METKPPKGFEFCDEAYAPGPDDFALNWHDKLGYWLCFKGVQLGPERRWIRPVGVSEEGEHVCRLDGQPCDKHAGQIHGQEAEELRRGVEKILEDYYNVDEVLEHDIDVPLRRLLDETDARDSLAFLEGQKAERKKLEQSVMNEARHLIRVSPTSPKDEKTSHTLHANLISGHGDDSVDSQATKRIFKYALPRSDGGHVSMPSGANVVSAGWQGDTMCVWAVVNEALPLVSREFKVVVTGQPFPSILAERCTRFHVRAICNEKPLELFVFDVGG